MEKPNVLLVVLDTARADTVYSLVDRGDLPGIQKFMQDGLVFRNAYANAPWTLPSHASMFTGQRATDHQCHAGTREFAPDVSPLPEVFSAAGYETRGISGNSWVSTEFGFDRGFEYLSTKWDRYWGGDDLSGVAKAEGVDKVKKVLELALSRQAPITLANLLQDQLFDQRTDFGATRITDRTIDWLESRDDRRPFFFFSNYIEPHLPYEPPAAYRRRFLGSEDVDDVNQDAWEYVAGSVTMSESEFDTLRGRYRAEIAYLDHHLERLYETLAATGYLEDTIVVLTADHGENIGDHQLMDHQYSLHETLLHVPLIVRHPASLGAGERTGLVELRDLYPTLAALCDIELPDEETSISTTNVTESARSEVFAEYRYPQPDMDALRETVSEPAGDWRRLDRTIRSVRTDDWKLIEYEDGEVRLFPAGDESGDVSDANPDVVRELVQRLDDNGIRLARGERREVAISDTTAQRLEDLGYV